MIEDDVGYSKGYRFNRASVGNGSIESCELTGQENEIVDTVSVEQFEETPSISAMGLSASPPCSGNHQNRYS